jgi:peptidyl-prolyl cis-trans isomerase SurA
MSSVFSIRMGNTRARRVMLAVCLACASSSVAVAQAPPSTSGAPIVLDSVVAVVNRHVILSSDLDDEIRLSILDPDSAGHTLTRAHALEQLISRTLIEQQIRQEDVQAAMPTQAEVEARLAEIRRELPACVREKCATDAGWNAFLASHDLTPERVTAYLRYRLEILRFIEQRFRPGIHIPEQQIAAYYNDTLLPQYAPGEPVPPFDQVAPRIEEILLQQQVNALFDDWLANLRKEGDVEVLDPALEPAESAAGGGSE